MILLIKELSSKAIAQLKNETHKNINNSTYIPASNSCQSLTMTFQKQNPTQKQFCNRNAPLVCKQLIFRPLV